MGAARAALDAISLKAVAYGTQVVTPAL